jgi:hypothetical protein
LLVDAINSYLQAAVPPHGKSKILRDQKRMAKWVLGREKNSSTMNMHSIQADKHRLSDQVCQLQSKLEKAAFHRDLIVRMELQKKDPQVSGYQDGQVVYRQPPETPDERRF